MRTCKYNFYSVNVSTLEMALCDKGLNRQLHASDYKSCIVGDKKRIICGKYYETSVDIYTTDDASHI